MSVEEENKEARGHRHDFLKEYYKMATMDLDRHLKGGWQTIVVLAGGAAALSAGGTGAVPLPYAALIALVAGLWGLLTVIDANYWSVRAIAFLSNVEAVYFSVEDRKRFNPYAGYHPPYKLMNSLNYLFALCGAFVVVTALVVVFPALTFHQGLVEAVRAAKGTQWYQLLPWIPYWLALLWGVHWVAAVYHHRAKSYASFVVESPGPGMRLTTAPLRHVDQLGVGGEPIPVESDTQAGTIAINEKAVRRASLILTVIRVIAVLGTIALAWLLTPYCPI